MSADARIDQLTRRVNELAGIVRRLGAGTVASRSPIPQAVPPRPGARALSSGITNPDPALLGEATLEPETGQTLAQLTITDGSSNHLLLSFEDDSTGLGAWSEWVHGNGYFAQEVDSLGYNVQAAAGVLLSAGNDYAQFDQQITDQSGTGLAKTVWTASGGAGLNLAQASILSQRVHSTGAKSCQLLFSLAGSPAVVIRAGDSATSIGTAIDLIENAVTTPAPSVNYARLFARDNGAGKTQLCVLFSSGAVQVLATQP